MKLNPYVLLVMKWLDDKNSVSREELRKNADAAAADTDTDYADAYAADAAADTDTDYADAAHWIIKYFEATGENKQNYIDQIEKGKK